MDLVFDSVRDIPTYFRFDSLRKDPFPGKVLMCPPDYYDVVDVKNSFMEGQYGKVNRMEALRQWQRLKSQFESVGLSVSLIPATPGLEDMVFTANQTFCGIDATQRHLCLLSNMRYPSRRLEVPAFDVWFSHQGYRVESLPHSDWLFEGAGDALWHPGRALIWGGYGSRTSQAVYGYLARRFFAPVARLNLTHPSFYHLDTCFCPIDERTVLYCPEAFDADGLSLIHRFFERRIEVTVAEAKATMCCNAAAFFGKEVVIQRGDERVEGELRRLGYNVHGVETEQFMKSGGSVFCLKMAYF